MDGVVDSETYTAKLEEYKKRQREITSKMKAHVNADETCLITAKTVLSLAKRAKELFMSSKRKTATSEFCIFELEIGREKAACDPKRTIFYDPSSITSTSKSPPTGHTSNWINLSQELPTLSKLMA